MTWREEFRKEFVYRCHTKKLKNGSERKVYALRGTPYQLESFIEALLEKQKEEYDNQFTRTSDDSFGLNPKEGE